MNRFAVATSIFVSAACGSSAREVVCMPECGPGQHCSDEGVCVSDSGVDAAADADCPSVTFQATKTTPTIQILVDNSGTMGYNGDYLGDTTKWEAIRRALTETTGVVTALQDEVYFGMTAYNGDEGGTCPQLQVVAPALGNQAAINQLFVDNNIQRGDSPTGEAVRAAVDQFLAVPPPAGSPPFILLATDGIGDTCAFPDDGTVNPATGLLYGEESALAAAIYAYANGVRLYYLHVGNSLVASHAQQVANLGVGLDQLTGQAPFFTATDTTSLDTALNAIINGTISCELGLDGDVIPGEEQTGVVRLNGVDLTWGVDWVLVDSNTIRLIGQACSDLQSQINSQVSGEFPCGAIPE
jgi:hypothetical protein